MQVVRQGSPGARRHAVQGGVVVGEERRLPAVLQAEAADAVEFGRGVRPDRGRGALADRPEPAIGRIPRRMTLVGAGSLDAGGRYLASAAQSPTGAMRLVVCDLRTGAVDSLGAYASPTPGAAGILGEDMPSVWSGDRFLAADPLTGTLTVYDAAARTTRRREVLTTHGTLQVWGAAK